MEQESRPAFLEVYKPLACSATTCEQVELARKRDEEDRVLLRTDSSLLIVRMPDFR